MIVIPPFSFRSTSPPTRTVYEVFLMAMHIVLVIYGFVKSDIKTILIPTTVFGTLAAESYGIGSLLTRASWVGLHLLQFCVSNQSVGLEEDRKNKPWRPIPAGRISVAAAQSLRWTLSIPCLVISLRLGVIVPGATLILATFAHNELQLGSSWFLRNVLNAVGYCAFNVGAACVGYSGGVGTPPHFGMHLMNAGAIFTTIQMQDFKDVEGDDAIGRRTLPLVYPTGSRVLTSVLIPLWSLVITNAWEANQAFSAVMLALGLYIGYRIMRRRTRESDRLSYVWYNVWLCLLHVAPFVSNVV